MPVKVICNNIILSRHLRDLSSQKVTRDVKSFTPFRLKNFIQKRHNWMTALGGLEFISSRDDFTFLWLFKPLTVYFHILSNSTWQSFSHWTDLTLFVPVCSIINKNCNYFSKSHQLFIVKIHIRWQHVLCPTDWLTNKLTKLLTLLTYLLTYLLTHIPTYLCI
jgi:hypothetical protein